MTNEFSKEHGTGRKSSSAPPCRACEALVPDALDGVLTAADQAWFDQHLGTCDTCAEMVADAQRGAAWLEMLKTPKPEPTGALLRRILAETSGQERLHLAPVPVAVPLAPGRGKVVPFRPEALSWGPVARMLETRLAMTAAMAFFSIALTLNLTGVHLRVADLRAGNVRNTWFQATAQAHRTYDNWRVMRVLTSRMASLRNGALLQEAEPDTQQKPEGSSRQEAPRSGEPVWMSATNSVAGGIA